MGPLWAVYSWVYAVGVDIVKVGIPRALAYFEYYPLWEAFFDCLGCVPVVSPATKPAIVQAGISLAGEDVCYPVKIMYGHVQALAGTVDAIFIPRLFSTGPETCQCPKLIGAADMLRHGIADLPPLITPYINLRWGWWGGLKALAQTALPITSNPGRILRAYRGAMSAWQEHQERCQRGYLPTVAGCNSRGPAAAGNLAVIGHPYNLYDSHVNMHILQRLAEEGYRVLTPQLLSPERVAAAQEFLRKPLFWSAARTIFAAGLCYAERDDVLGIIHLASFGCGIESLVSDLVQRVAKAKKKPCLFLTMDEHTGVAGVETRLEAFLDMVAWQKEAAFCG